MILRSWMLNTKPCDWNLFQTNYIIVNHSNIERVSSIYIFENIYIYLIYLKKNYIFETNKSNGYIQGKLWGHGANLL